MAKIFAWIGVWILSSFLVKLSVALGIGFMTYKGISYAVDSALDLLTVYLSSIPNDIITLFAMSGAGEAISIIGSAIISVATLQAARVWVGVVS